MNASELKDKNKDELLEQLIDLRKERNIKRHKETFNFLMPPVHIRRQPLFNCRFHLPLPSQNLGVVVAYR